MIRLAAGRDEELPCVWVLAGVLNHRPCHRRYECEECELYRALQGKGRDDGALPEEVPGLETLAGQSNAPSSPSASSAASAYLADLTRNCTLYLDRPYTEGHLWIDASIPEALVVGMDCQAIRVLHPLDEITLPRVGVWLKRGEAMGWLLRGHLALPLRAPISGEVLEVNPLLHPAPGSAEVGLVDDSWLVRLQPHEPMERISGLLRGEEMLAWYQDKLTLLRECVDAAMAGGVEAGPTMNDGGDINRDLEEVLGPEAFRALVDQMFRGGP